jgi:hypothetical protein
VTAAGLFKRGLEPEPADRVVGLYDLESGHRLDSGVAVGRGEWPADPPTETRKFVDTMVLLLARDDDGTVRPALVARVVGAKRS